MIMPICHPLADETVAALRTGGPDANGRPAETTVSNGSGTPCRSCLCDVPDGAGMLVAALRPFDGLHPYAETGPIFLCAADCTPFDARGLPPVMATSPDYLLKGYGGDERIVYGTGRITPAAEIATYAATLLSDPAIAFVDVRSARNNCYLARLTRG